MEVEQKPRPSPWQFMRLELIYGSLFAYFIIATSFVLLKRYAGFEVPELLSLFFLQFVVIGILVYLFCKGWRPQWKLSQNKLLWVVASFVIYFAGLFFLDFIFSDSERIRKAQSFSLQAWPVVLVQLFFAPVFEELYFRDFLFRSLRRHFAKVLAALIFSSIFFMLAHLHVHLGAFLLGLVSGVLYLWTKSVLPSVFFHFISNFSIYFIPVYFPNLFHQMLEWKLLQFFYGS